MTGKTIASRSILAAIPILAWTGCSQVVITPGSSSAPPGTGGAQATSTSTGSGGTETTSNSTGGSGGGAPSCSVSLPAGCGCPDNPKGAWTRVFSDPSPNTRMVTWAQGQLPIAPDGSTVFHLETRDEMGVTLSSQLVKLDARGDVVWEHQQLEQWFWTPTPDPRDCSTLISGRFPSDVTELLGQPVTCSSAICPFVARLDAGGSLTWVKVYDFGSDFWGDVWIAGVLADGRIALGGAYQGTLDLGNGPLSAEPGSGAFAALLSPSGDALWSRRIVKQPLGGGSFVIASATVSPAGDVIVAMPPDGNVDLGEGPIPPPAPGLLGGLALASYDPTGALLYGKAIFSEFANLPELVWSPAGHLVLGERAQGLVDYGGGPIGTTSNLWKAVVAYGPDGQHLWSVALDDYDAPGIGVDGSNHVWASAGYGAIAELAPGGALVAMHTIGGSGKRPVSAIGFTPGGATMIAGMFDETLDLGSGPITVQSERDVFVAVLGP